MNYNLVLHVDSDAPEILSLAFSNAANYRAALPNEDFRMVLVANGPAVKRFTREDLELAYDAGTYGSASVLGLPDYGLSEGCWADLVVFPVENRACALLEGPMPRFVIKRGVLVARDGELTDAVPPCPE